MLSMSNVYLIYMFARSRTEAERGKNVVEIKLMVVFIKSPTD